MKDGIYRLDMQREELASPAFYDIYKMFPKSYYAPIALGVDALGDRFDIDLNKIPNLLVGGTTGSGKSVCINTVIMSWLFMTRPDELKLILVAPKMVALRQFGELPHHLVVDLVRAIEYHTLNGHGLRQIFRGFRFTGTRGSRGCRAQLETIRACQC